MQHRRARGPAVRATRLATLFLVICVAPPAWAQAGASVPKQQGPTTIEAQSIEGVSELEVTARGNVELKRDDISIFADELRYNQEFGRVEADGGVRLERDGDRFFGPRLRFDTTNDTGVLEEPKFIIRRDQTSRGSAERMELLGKDHVKLTKGTYTTCEPDKEDWKFEAGELDLDYDAGTGKVRDGRLRFFDTTVFALPFGSFPLENRRKTGFLAPYYSHNTRRGLEAGIPFYWNIAPERDLTLLPVYMSKRGEQLKAEFRYIDVKYSGDFRLEHLPSDRVLGISRTGLTLQHEQQFSPELTGRIDLNKVSDDRYFVDLSSQVRTVSIGNLQREGFLQYTGALGGTSYYAQGRVQTFQTLQDPLAPIVSPYHRVPQLNFGATRNEIGGRADLFVPVEYVRFTHPTLVEGDRLSLNPVISVPFLGPGHFLTPKFGVRYVDYHLSGTGPGQADRQGITVPWLSVDGGLVFERGVNWFGKSGTQTLEPRAYYLYVPHRDQDQIPLFDTALADFNYTQLFNENRFIGGDRIGDANQLTLAVTSRYLGAGGEEMFRATVGQRYSFSDQRVGLTPASPVQSRGGSDILASVGGRFARDWTADATVQYNPREGQMDRYGYSLRYTPEIAKVIGASYRFNRDLLHQIDVSGQWPVRPGWYAVGRYNYSLLDGRLLEGIGGLEYNAGCWVFRAVVQRLQAATQTTSTGIFVQLELNGLGSVGSDEVLNLLRRNIPGYAVTNPRDGRLAPPSLRPQLPFQQVY